MRSGSRVRALALFALAAQNTVLVLLTKFSYRTAAKQYTASTVLVWAEVVKLCFSCIILVISKDYCALVSAFAELRTDFSRLSIPALLYAVQNSLTFEAMRLLQPTVFMVCSQSKILSSAFFSVILLKTRITCLQLTAIGVLVVGMMAVQYDESQHTLSEHHAEQPQNFKGIVYVFSSAGISGFLGAYLERIYKATGGHNGPQAIWQRNVQLAFFSIPVTTTLAVLRDMALIKSFGILYGYDSVIVSIVLLQATGGLVNAVVMRYAGNVLKCFAVSASICFCALLSASVQHGEGAGFGVVGLNGVIFVIIATFMFSCKRS